MNNNITKSNTSNFEVIASDSEADNSEADNSDSKAESKTETNSDVEAGVVKWFDRKRGFGFIIPDDDGQDILIHSSVIETIGRRDLPEGCHVNYISAQGAKGQHVIEI